MCLVLKTVESQIISNQIFVKYFLDKTISVAGRSSTVDLNEKKAKVEGPTVSSVKGIKN